MKDKILKLSVEVAEYTIANKTTLRETGKVFGITRSTVHNYLTKHLPEISPSMAKEARAILDLNKAERGHRGGTSTQRKHKEEIKNYARTLDRTATEGR